VKQFQKGIFSLNWGINLPPFPSLIYSVANSSLFGLSGSEGGSPWTVDIFQRYAEYRPDLFAACVFAWEILGQT